MSCETITSKYLDICLMNIRIQKLLFVAAIIMYMCTCHITYTCTCVHEIYLIYLIHIRKKKKCVHVEYINSVLTYICR